MLVPEFLVLLSGPVAGGKTTLREELIAAHGFEPVRSSGFLRQLAAQRDLAADRTTLQDLGDGLDRQTDYRWLLDQVCKPAFAASPAQHRWLIDAVRKRRQVEHFRAAYGHAVFHVHVTAPETVLHRRYTVRGDSTPYEVAIQHENEVASRSLSEIADLVLDTSKESLVEGALLVMRCFEQRDGLWWPGVCG